MKSRVQSLVFCLPLLTLAALSTASALASVGSSAARHNARLGTYNIDPRRVFVAGFSSGAFFAVQTHVAHSHTFKGAAIYAGAQYWCAEGNIYILNGQCSASYVSHLASSEKYLNRESKRGVIDSESNLRGQPVYLWSGMNDTGVLPAVMGDLDAEYVHYGAQVVYDNAFPAVHGWESPDGESFCGVGGSPFVIRCLQGSVVYDSEQVWLSMFLGKLRRRNDGALRGKLINFDQTEFGAAPQISLDTNGFVFVPHDCAAGKRCGFVVIFHGCRMTQADIGTAFITQGGVLPWADTNHLIVLYPFTVWNNAKNPSGCWDIWGYDGADHALRSGSQMTIIYSMVQRVTGRT